MKPLVGSISTHTHSIQHTGQPLSQGLFFCHLTQCMDQTADRPRIALCAVSGVADQTGRTG